MVLNCSVIDRVTGRGLPLKGNDIDTDRIIPARFLRCVTFDGLGDKAFYDERFAQDGTEKSHPFNNERYRDASILIVNGNFGCGSSREHAPQALMRFGIKAIVGESFAEIFAGNCTSLGIPVLTADGEHIRDLQERIESFPATEMTINIESAVLSWDKGEIRLEINRSSQFALLDGSWDTIDVLLKNDKEIDRVCANLPY